MPFYLCLAEHQELVMDREAWHALIHGVAKSWTRLSDWTELKDFPGGPESKASAYNARNPGSDPGSGRSPGEGNGNPLRYSCLEVPWTEEPGRLQFMGLQRVRLNWARTLTVCLCQPQPPSFSLASFASGNSKSFSLFYIFDSISVL